MDTDIVLLSRSDEVFEHAEAGKIVGGCDGWQIAYGDEFRVYGDGVAGKSADGLNSGQFSIDLQTHWDVVGLWAFTSNHGQYSPHHGYPVGLPGFGDQGILNALLSKLGKPPDYHILPHGVWHDFRNVTTLKILRREEGGSLVVENCELRQRQRISHCVGCKWWHLQAENYHVIGDKLACFRHFDQVNLACRL